MPQKISEGIEDGNALTGTRINIYSMIWCGGGVYLFGFVVDTYILPTNPETAYHLEHAYAILETLKSKLYLASFFIMEIERSVAKKRRRTMTDILGVEFAF
ncbi:18042_t:CDS:2 [Dentiscutata erythropus]|uniref:18042_t:CDS:1 n=1 Tax=Dentiscutata erythropus TaxID=1348616 RepID=A0A9N8WI76_9GLOM|nr:18042_t:CDS:2 [Dentiscutata erythropus]